MVKDYRSETGPSPELRAIEEKHSSGSLRTETILALENVIAESAALLDKAIVLNVLIRSKRLPLPLIGLAFIYGTQEAAEMMLKEMELRARGELRPEQTLSHGIVYR